MVFARFSYRRLRAAARPVRGEARPEQGPDAEGYRRRHGWEDLGGFKELCRTLHTELLTSTERCTPRVEHAAGPQGPGADLSAYGNLPHRALGGRCS